MLYAGLLAVAFALSPALPCKLPSSIQTSSVTYPLPQRLSRNGVDPSFYFMKPYLWIRCHWARKWDNLYDLVVRIGRYVTPPAHGCR